MTRDELANALAADIRANAENHSDRCLAFKINHTLMRIANAELTNALEFTNTPEFEHEFYFSDSQFDELSNPANIIDECNSFLIAYLDSIIDDLIALIPTMIDNIEFLLSYDLFDPDAESPEFPCKSLDELLMLLRTEFNIA